MMRFSFRGNLTCLCEHAIYHCTLFNHLWSVSCLCDHWRYACILFNHHWYRSCLCKHAIYQCYLVWPSMICVMLTVNNTLVWMLSSSFVVWNNMMLVNHCSSILVLELTNTCGYTIAWSTGSQHHATSKCHGWPKKLGNETVHWNPSFILLRWCGTLGNRNMKPCTGISLIGKNY